MVAFPWGLPPRSKKPLHVPAVVCLSEATLAMLFQQLAAMSASGVTAPGAAALMAMPSPWRSRDRQASLCLCQERPEWTTSSRQGAWEHWAPGHVAIAPSLPGHQLCHQPGALGSLCAARRLSGARSMHLALLAFILNPSLV